LSHRLLSDPAASGRRLASIILEREPTMLAERALPDEVLREIYDIIKFARPGMNTQPMRLVFVRTAAAKERLKPHVLPSNVDKTMAHVTAIIGHDLAFHEHLPTLFPTIQTRKQSSREIGR